MKKRIRALWANPPSDAALTLEYGDGTVRDLGPRGLLDLDEAAAALQRSPAEVQRVIRAGFLRSTRRGLRRPYVTVRACHEFLAEERRDAAAAAAAETRARVRGDKPIPLGRRPPAPASV